MSEKESVPKKQGVHGWRAFLLMFGCGAAAALLIFGAIVGVGRIIGNSFTSSSSSGEESPEVEVSREPRETVPPGLLNLCELIEAEALMGATPDNRTDEEDDYVDTAEEGGEEPRTVSDSCSWGVVGSEGRNWDFEIKYIAHLEDDGDTSMADAANDSFDDFIRSASETESDDEGEVEGLDGPAQYFYSDANEGKDSYNLVRLIGSGAYQVHLAGVDVSEQDFRAEVMKNISYLDQALERHTPD